MEQYDLLGKVRIILKFAKETNRVSTDLVRMIISIRNYYLSKGTITAKQYNAIERIYIQVERVIIKQFKQPIL